MSRDDVIGVIRAAVDSWMDDRDPAELRSAADEELMVEGYRCVVSVLPGALDRPLRVIVDIELAPEHVMRAEIEIGGTGPTVH